MRVFFRVDDVGLAEAAFGRLLDLFTAHQQALNAALIPAAADNFPATFGAHPWLEVVAHGLVHKNFEPSGKKSEFGPSRDPKSVRTDLLEARRLLSDQFANFYPCFVPPWNRIDPAFLPLLPECGFAALSRSGPSAQRGFPEWNVQFDLHSRKKPRQEAREIFAQLRALQAEGQGVAGLMLHHALMNEEDFREMDLLLGQLNKRGIEAHFFSELLHGRRERNSPEMRHV